MQCARKFVKSSISIMIVILNSGTPFICYPTYLYLFKNARPMTVPVILPFTDPETTKGYYQNVANQILMNLVGLIGNVGLECISSFLINNIHVAIETICFELDEFGNLLETEVEKTDDKRLLLRNILIQIQDVDR